MAIMSAGAAHHAVDSLIHRELLLSLIAAGACPSVGQLAAQLFLTEAEVEAALHRLEANHAVVLHPGTPEPWVVHPFSTTPTLFWVCNDRRGWWAPCIWCGLGVACLVDGPVRIQSCFGGEAEPFSLTDREGRIDPAGLVVHFPIPVARAWDNVHRHCACTLVFRSAADVPPWCARHGIRQGEIVPVEQVARLARIWYADHLSPTWTKPTIDQAAACFAEVGLTSPHWRMPRGAERF